MFTRVIFLVAYNILVSSIQADDGPIVNTAIGTIRGVSSDDGQYNMYMGIPYGRVNETNPFGASIPYKFEELFDAIDGSSKCPQIEEFNNTFVGDLDCLRLNIYTPKNITSYSQLPVIVWIYGGGFSYGFNGKFIYGPKFFVRHNLIIVVINYRLGPYGFMCLDIPEVPGNQGLKDQIAALRWVRSHISAFGGDPEKITIAGNSAGARSIDFHLHRDNNDEKLFTRAILQSGSSLATTYFKHVKDAPIIIAKHLQRDTDDIYDALTFLATAPPRDVILASSSLGIINLPCIEKKFQSVESYMTVNWIQEKVPAVNNMSVMIGVTDDELGMMRSSPGLRSVGPFLGSMFYTEHKDFQGMTELVTQFYLGDDNLLSGLNEFMSDTNFVHPAYRSVYRYMDNNVANIYFYHFYYVGNRNFLRRRDSIHFKDDGAYHTDELGYMFDMEFMPEDITAEDQLVIDKLTKMWGDFVKYGDPTPELTELIDVKWEPIRRDSPIYSMNINKQLSLTTTSPIADRIAFWDVFYEKNGYLQRILSIT